MGPVTLELLDHHRVALASITHSVLKAGGPVVFTFPSMKIADTAIAAFGIEGLHVQVGDFHYFDMGHFQPDSYEPLTIGQGTKWRFGGGRSRSERTAFKRPPRASLH